MVVTQETQIRSVYSDEIFGRAHHTMGWTLFCVEGEVKLIAEFLVFLLQTMD